MYTAPTPKKDFILYKISLSFSCRFISNEILTFLLKISDISTITLKQPSASVNPANQKGSIFLFKGISDVKIGTISGKAVSSSDRFRILLLTTYQSQNDHRFLNREGALVNCFFLLIQ